MNWNCGREPKRVEQIHTIRSFINFEQKRKQTVLSCLSELKTQHHHNIVCEAESDPFFVSHQLFSRTQSVPSNDIFILLSPFRVFEQYWIKLFTPNMFVCFRQKDWLFISHSYPFIDKKNWATKNEKTNYRGGIYDGGLKAFPTRWRNHERLRMPMNGAVEKNLPQQ